MVQTINNTIDSASKTLSIQVSPNGLSFCVINSNQEVTLIEQQNFDQQLSPDQVLQEIKKTLDHNTHLKNDFTEVKVIYQNDLYTFVPKALFDNQLLKEYLQYNIKVLENDFIAYDEMDQHEIVVVYIPYVNINNFFFENFGTFTYTHAATILADNLLSKEKNTDTNSIFVHINTQSFDLVVINKGKFILGNTFCYDTKEDFLYYLMFTAEQLQLNPEEFRLVLLGNITTDSECYSIAYQYIRNISFGDRANRLTIARDIKPFEAHEHFILLSNI